MDGAPGEGILIEPNEPYEAIVTRLSLIMVLVGLWMAIVVGGHARAQGTIVTDVAESSPSTPSLSLREPLPTVAEGDSVPVPETALGGGKHEGDPHQHASDGTQLAVQERTHESFGTSVEETTAERLEDSFYDPFAEKEPQEEIYDPWESFNTTMFTFNRRVDKYVLKPAAEVYDDFMPEFLQEGIRNGFSNFFIVPRLANNLLQGKFKGAGVEVGRFVINTALGLGGFFDVAGKAFGLKTPTEDLGQTFAVYGADPGPYLILPFLPPLTVRDGLGYFANNAMNPAWWLLPFPTIFGINGGEILNERSLNLELFQGVEESTVDLYGAVRNAYYQKRAKAIKE